MVEIIVGRNPLDPADHHTFQSSANLTIADVIRQHHICFALPTICALNTPDNVILRAEWEQMRLREHDTVIFLPLMQGGGGGSNPLKIILAVALIVFAAPLAAGLGSLGAAIGTAGFVKFGAALLLSAIVPQPKSPSMGGWGDIKQASPTYSIAAQGNALGLEQPIPCVYGNHKIFPPYIAQPWSEYFNNEQHLYQVFIVGHGQYMPLHPETVLIEDSQISSFSKVHWQHVYYDAAGNANVVYEYNNIPSAVHALWHHQVVSSMEVSGQELQAPNEARDNDGWIGPFVVNKAGTTITAIRLDKTCPRGLYYANDDGSFATRTVEWEDHAQLIDDYGTPLGGWMTLNQPEWVSGTASFSRSTTVPAWITVDTGISGTSDYSASQGVTDLSVKVINGTDHVTFLFTPYDDYVGDGEGGYYAPHTTATISYHYGFMRDTATPAVSGATSDALSWTRQIWVSSGRYQVRSRRVDNKDTSSRAGHELRWTGLSGVTSTPPRYRDVTVLYTRLVATDKISQQASRKVNCIVQRKLPRWDKTTGRWTDLESTRNPIWAACDVVRSGYGADLDDGRLNLPALAELAAGCDQRGDYFDYVAESQATVLEVLATIGRAFRAVPRIPNGVVSFVRDQKRSSAKIAFSMNQMVAGSLSMKYVMPNERANSLVEVEYYERKVWGWRKVLCGAGSDSRTPQKVRLDGVTELAQAQREGKYLALTNQKRRTFVTFQSEMDGLIPSYGDMILVAHELPQWGQTAHARAWNSTTRTLTVDHDLAWPTGQAYCVLRTKDGTPSKQYPVKQGTSPGEIIFSTQPSPAPYAGLDYEPTTVLFGGSERVIVIGIKPRGVDRVEITGVVEDDAVHV